MQKDILKNVVLAIEYIEAHLTEKLDLEKVANAVHYSKYYLHRIFAGTVGLTPHEYQRRRQLTEAAKLLVFSNKSILDIALLAGYESQQAFTNIFTAMYKIPPSKYRDNEKFYPLQLKFCLNGSFNMLNQKLEVDWKVGFALKEDIPKLMVLVRLVVDGYPYFNEEDFKQVLQQKIATKQSLIIKDGEVAIGILLFSDISGSIDFLGCHPLYRKKGIPKAFLNVVMDKLLKGRQVSITTYRAGDRADTGQRQEVKDLGFAEAELLMEFGYPTQRFTIKPNRDLPPSQ